MEKAKQAVSSFLSNDGKHKTSIDQDVRQAVTEEQVMPHRHENVTTAVDRDVHQEHHQTRIQPIKHTETLPEEHHHNVIPVQHKTVHHGKEGELRDTLDRDAARFADKSVTHETTHSSTAAPVMTGERIHHHVHEHVQPVIQKETIQPKVVHTTVPIHETHHAAPIVHETTTLPTKTLEEFTSGGHDVLKGRGTNMLKEYEGCPKPYQEGPGMQEKIHGGQGLREGVAGEGFREGMTGSNRGAMGEGLNRQGMGAEGLNAPMGEGYNTREGTSHHRGAAAGGMAAAGATAAYGAHKHRKHEKDALGRRGSNSSLSSSDEEAATGAQQKPRKPSLMDRLNPKKDADGDGKTGILS